MAGYNPYQTNSYQATQFFPQPQGNVYIINNSMEIANIPVVGSSLLFPLNNFFLRKVSIRNKFSNSNGVRAVIIYTYIIPLFY